jgi:hypothetical protein
VAIVAKRKALGTIAALGALGAAASRGRSASNEPRKLVLSDSFGGREEIDPFYRDVAEDITSKPRMTRGMSASEVASMIKNPAGRALTDSEMKYAADMLDPQGKYVRSGSGVVMGTEDGEPIRTGSGFKKGGIVKSPRRGDGIVQRGKTRGKMV